MMINETQSNEKFVVLFIPEPQGGVSLDQLKLNIKRLFNIPDIELNTLFSGKPRVIKSGADEDTALMYKRAIERSGGACWVEPEQDEQVSSQLTA